MTAEAAVLDRAAIAGLGITEVGKVYGRTAADFAADAVRLAVADAGLALDDVDGLLLSNGITGGVELRLARDLGMRNLRLLSNVIAYGATATAQVQIAAAAVASGMASVVVCVHADAPLRAPGTSSGGVYSGAAAHGRGEGLERDGGRLGRALGEQRLRPRRPPAHGALRHHERAARRDRGGPTRVGRDEPAGALRDPITVADHQASRWVVEPLHLLDCCVVSNGGIAIVVTTADRARDLAQPPVYVWGAAQCHPGYTMARDSEFGLRTGAAIAGPAAMAMAGITPADVDVRELYDCYTYTNLVTLEDYGFCAKGEGGALAASGALAPGGSLADEHRRRPAVRVLPLGDDPAVGGHHPGARPRW